MNEFPLRAIKTMYCKHKEVTIWIITCTFLDCEAHKEIAHKEGKANSQETSWFFLQSMKE